MAQSFTTDVTQWQIVDNTPKKGSRNLIESGAVYEKTKGIQHETDETGNEEILIESKDNETLVKVTEDYVNCKNLRSNGVDVLNKIDSIASESPTPSDTDEILFTEDDYSETFGGEIHAKVGSYGVKSKGYLDIEGNDAIQPYINKIKNKNARFIFLGDLHYSGKDNNLDNEVPVEDLPSSMGEGHSIRYRFQHLVDALNAEHHKRPIDLVLCTGDVIENDSFASFIKEFAWQLEMPIVFGPGNHDARPQSYWIEYFGNKWSFNVETDDFLFVFFDVWDHINVPTGVHIPTYQQIYDRIEDACSHGKLVISFSHSEGGDYRENMISVASHFPNYIAHVSGHTHSMRLLHYGNFTVINDGNFAYNGDGIYRQDDVRGLFGFNNIEVENGSLKTWFIWPEYNYRKADFTLPFSEGTLHKVDDTHYTVDNGQKYTMIENANLESIVDTLQLYKLKDIYLKKKIAINENR